MSQYKAPIKDVRFLLYDVLGWERLSALPAFADATPDLIDAVRRMSADPAPAPVRNAMVTP